LNSRNDKQSTDDDSSSIVIIAALFALGSFIILVIFAAALACSVGFRDADVCWLLAIGRAIVTHHGLSLTDPFSSNLFSYVSVAPDLPLIQYQWLGAVLYYKIWQWTGPVGLLSFTGLIAYTALIALPMSFFERGRVPKLTAFVICVLGFGASYLRIMTRAHTLGMLLFAILVAVNLHYQVKNRRQQIITLVVSSLVMVIWTNVHLFFPLGAAFLGLTWATNALAGWLKEKKLPDYSPMQFITLVLASFSTIINPWGYHFWLFIYKLTHSPVSFDNIDNQAPATGSPAAIFLITLAIVYLGCTIFLLRRRNEYPANHLAPLLYFLFVGVVIIKQAVLIPLLVIIAAAGLSELYAQQAIESTSTKNFLTDINVYLNRVWRFLPTNGVAPLMALGLIGAYTATTSRTAQLPEDTVYFKPPMKAIEFLKAHPQKGQIFNDALYGSCMMWYLDQPPNLFIDGRFSVYDPAFVKQYENMMLCREDWRQLLKQFQISQVFAPSGMPIAKTLKNDPEWKQIYCDDRSTILVHEPNRVKPGK
jgi:hypothetical protein